jgi:hypothetical protein
MLLGWQDAHYGIEGITLSERIRCEGENRKFKKDDFADGGEGVRKKEKKLKGDPSQLPLWRGGIC